MANFNAHISAGTATGAAILILNSTQGYTDNALVMITAFTAAVCGSFLPDLDSDSRRPVRIVFTLLAAVVWAISVLALLFLYEFHFIKSIIYASLAGLGVRYALAGLFKKNTRHRGIFHSIPAALLSGLIVLYILNTFPGTNVENNLIFMSVIAGYLSHLILDEIWATKSFMGIPYKRSASAGSALKFYSKSKYATLSVYLLIGFFVYLDYFF